VAKGSAVVLDSIVKDYRRGAIAVRALDNVSFAVMPGTVTAVAGRSGSGKSTLMHLIGALDRPTSGRVVVGGRDLSDMGDEEATAFRRTGVGFVFQFFNLIPTLEAWENVAVPGLLGGAKLSSLRNDAVLLLDRVGLGDRAHHRPGELSGGQLQRVARPATDPCR
jgi:putative ABC transport system ATP-binding protein